MNKVWFAVCGLLVGGGGRGMELVLVDGVLEIVFGRRWHRPGGKIGSVRMLGIEIQ